MEYFLYFTAGIIEDFFFTLSIRYVAKGKALAASLCAFLQTVILVGVIYDILTRLEGRRSLIAIIIYAFGISVGTFIAMKFRIGHKD